MLTKKTAYHLDRPALISFSGGRTSGFMLHEIINAFYGELPSDVIPVFANTGMEHEKTYRFVEEVSRCWTPITVVERTKGGGFQVVDIKDANRAGKPFEDLIEDKQYLPNPVARICTLDLKVKPMQKFARERMGWKEYTSAIGIRADEERRVAKMRAPASRERDAFEDRTMPLAEEGVCIEDVSNFWATQRKRDDGFDLDFEPGKNLFGNCVGCFLKGRRKLDEIARAEPSALEWWARMEEKKRGVASPAAAFFRTDRPSYRQILLQAQAQPLLFDAGDDDTLPCDCHS